MNFHAFSRLICRDEAGRSAALVLCGALSGIRAKDPNCISIRCPLSLP
jgi:hypothetical protein